MSTAAPSTPPSGIARVLPDGRDIVGMLITAALSAVLAGFITYAFTKKLNADASVQQQYVSTVQDFAATGARVDAAITNLADAAVDADEVDAAKKEARQAIAAHAASTLALQPVVGKGNVEAYMVGVADMRKLVDATDSVDAARRASKGRFALIENRNLVIAEARKNIYG